MRPIGASRPKASFGFPVAGEAEEGADHLDEAVARVDLDQDLRFLLAELLLLADQEADCAVHHPEALGQLRVPVLDRDASAGPHEEVGDEARWGCVSGSVMTTARSPVTGFSKTWPRRSAGWEGSALCAEMLRPRR